METIPHLPKAPLFRDPVHDGAADPVVVWNRAAGSWWLLYTNRRADVDAEGVAYCHGSDIGIAESRDGGGRWLYRGILPGLEFEPGRNTFWAPEVLWHEGLYHMYATYVRGIPTDWAWGRDIVHYTSPDLWNWRFESVLALSSGRVIDACVHRMPDGRWRMWYKDEDHGSHTYAADSGDLYHWDVVGPVIVDCSHEGPNVFFWKGFYWMVTDPWHGLGVYRSTDAEHWHRRADILDRPGTRAEDGTQGRHADVLVQGDEAFLFYFTHPELPDGTDPGVWTRAHRRTSIQVARLEARDGELTCDRDAPFGFRLADGGAADN